MDEVMGPRPLASWKEAPHGGLGQWIVVESGKTANYQTVVPSTWNAGPRDHQGQAGAYEAALKGHAVHDGKQPLEVLRTIHSFDPCIACAVHVVDLEATAPLGLPGTEPDDSC